jgi:hypothetical protein
MLSQAGAAAITSIESNSTSFLKCLIAQNALKFNADFTLGDFRPYLDACTDTYDLLVASGREVISYKQSYLGALKWRGFCRGSAPTSY